ncbi:prolyl oligopeptidase family serine peptidase [Oceanospirillaceae bacterium ASx5O]|nr:prolyl oligopeptidase family serine peptidase [Oceanospirillaceae bacterium ASx5O]
MKKTLLSLCAAGALCLPTAQAQADSALAPALTLVAGILNVGVFPKSDRYTTDDDIVVVANDGTELAANIFVPNQPGLKPAVIFINSWALNEYEYLTEAARFAEEGYVVLSYSTRGFGTSGGLIDTAGPQDMADLSKVIDYLIANYEVDPQRIGTAGISYGAGMSLLGAAHDSRIRAVASLSGWGSLQDALYADQTPRLVWGELLTLSSGLLGNPDPIIEEQWNKVLSGTDVESVYPWTDLRSPLNYVEQINANGTAIYMAQNYGDNLFQPNSVLRLFGQLDVPKHIDLQAGTHAFPEIIGMIGGGNTKVLNNMHRWFAEHLKGETGAMNGQAPVQMKTKLTSNWEGFSDFPLPEARTQTWHLHPRSLLSNGKLDDSPYQNRRVTETRINSLLDSVASTQVPIVAELLEQADVPVTAPMTLLLRNHSVAFDSGRLSSGMKIRGIPQLSMAVEPQHSNLQLVAYLYDVNALGIGTLITHAPVTLPHTTAGKTEQVNLDLVAVSYDIKPGNRLMLVVDTQDLLYAKPAKSYFAADFRFGGNLTSTLSVPVL